MKPYKFITQNSHGKTIWSPSGEEDNNWKNAERARREYGVYGEAKVRIVPNPFFHYDVKVEFLSA